MHKRFVRSTYKEECHVDYGSQVFINERKRISQHHPCSWGVTQQLAKFMSISDLLETHGQGEELCYEMQVQLVEVKPHKQTDDAIHIVLYR